MMFVMTALSIFGFFSSHTHILTHANYLTFNSLILPGEITGRTLHAEIMAMFKRAEIMAMFCICCEQQANR